MFSGQPGSIALDDVLASVEASGDFSLGGTGATSVEIVYKPESPVFPDDFRFAASQLEISSVYTLSYCGCTSSFSLDDTTDGFRMAPIDGASSSSGESSSAVSSSQSVSGSSPRCKGAYTVPKSSKKNDSGKNKAKKSTTAAISGSTTGSFNVVIGAAVAAVVVFAAAMFVVKRRLQRHSANSRIAPVVEFADDKL